MPRSKEARREYERRKEKRRYDRRKAEVICVKCRQPVFQGGILCKYHRNKALASTRTTAAKKKAKGLCNSWGCYISVAGTGYVLCEKCRAKQSEYAYDRYYSRKDNGLCVLCSSPASTGIYCEPCRINHNERYQRCRTRKTGEHPRQ